jgi:hypothetical protein
MKAREGLVVNQLEIEKFENEVSSKAKKWFAAGASRLFDRAVVTFPNVSAEALAESVFKKLGLETKKGWENVDTPNQCHWDAVRMFKTWWQPEPSVEDLRGMLVVGVPLLETKDFAKLLILSYEELQQQQSWEV